MFGIFSCYKSMSKLLVLKMRSQDRPNIDLNILAVVMGLQFFALNTPFRVFHILYGWAFCMIYVLNTYIDAVFLV